jgi:23S rRNA (adenine2030-N6)-methyltransferase
MNYRHLYHAGNFADVLKHLVLLALIDALKRKDKPFCVLDTHAGLCRYSLQSSEAQKKQEYQRGIDKLFKCCDTMPALIQQYLSSVQQYNLPGKLEHYPGSSLFARLAMREGDRLIACELHPEDVKTLKNDLNIYADTIVHHMNGYHAMKAFLPPKEARGLVLIDPPFEETNEFEEVMTHLTLALKHWRNGVYAIWYPIKDRFKVNNFYHELSCLNFPMHRIEFSLLSNENTPGMRSCGIVIINTPWQVPELLKTEILPALEMALEAKWSLNSENIQ